MYKQSKFVAGLDEIINARRKMTSPLYQTILGGNASLPLLRNFVVQRYPIKVLWTRNLLGIASCIEDYGLRLELVENIYEEETGALTSSKRHLETFVDFGLSLGLSREEIVSPQTLLPETEAVIRHNVNVCNNPQVHFTLGVASALLLMEGQPPIVTTTGRSMEEVMRDVYGLPPEGWLFFHHHASGHSGDQVSELEAEHSDTARRLLDKYCVTPELQAQATQALQQAVELRHRHFDAILVGAPNEMPPFRYQQQAVEVDVS